MYPAFTKVSKPDFIKEVNPPHKTTCSPKRSVSHSSLKVVSIIPVLPPPTADAYDKPIFFVSLLTDFSIANKHGTPLLFLYSDLTKCLAL